MEKSEIRWGIVGCGDVCEVKSGPALQKAEGSRLVAVMRRDAAKAEDFARRHGVERWGSNAEELICASDIDAVYIATPPGSHRDLALQVAEAGKICYVEKPMARNHAECREMIEAFDRAALPLFVAYYRRSLPRFATAKAILDSGKLGGLKSIDCHLANAAYLQADPKSLPWRLRPEESGGGLLQDLGSHLIDLLDHLLGPLLEVEGESRNASGRLDLPDQTEMCFKTGDAVPGRARWDFASKKNEDRIRLEGESGWLELSCFGNEALRLGLRGGVEEIFRPNPPHVHQPLVQSLVDEILGRGGCCPSTGISAARASCIMDRIGGRSGNP